MAHPHEYCVKSGTERECPRSCVGMNELESHVYEHEQAGSMRIASPASAKRARHRAHPADQPKTTPTTAASSTGTRTRGGCAPRDARPVRIVKEEHALLRPRRRTTKPPVRGRLLVAQKLNGHRATPYDRSASSSPSALTVTIHSDAPQGPMPLDADPIDVVAEPNRDRPRETLSADTSSGRAFAAPRRSAPARLRIGRI
jgi:hypothetical protein